MAPIDPIRPDAPRNEITPIRPAPPAWRATRERRRDEERRRHGHEAQDDEQPADNPGEDDGMPHVDVRA
jgi:hypothetical protein